MPDESIGLYEPDPKGWKESGVGMGAAVIFCILAAALYFVLPPILSERLSDPELISLLRFAMLLVPGILLLYSIQVFVTAIRTIELTDSMLILHKRLGEKAISLEKIGFIDAVDKPFAKVDLYDGGGKLFFSWLHPHDRDVLVADLSRRTAVAVGRPATAIVVPRERIAKRTFGEFGGFFLVVIVIAMGLASVYMPGSGGRDYYTSFILDKGIPVEAVVESVIAEKDGSHTVAYNLLPASGYTHRREVVLYGDGTEDWSAGDVLQAAYLANVPGDSRLRAEYSRAGIFFHWFGRVAIWGLLAASACLLLWRRPRWEEAACSPENQRPLVPAPAEGAASPGVASFGPVVTGDSRKGVSLIMWTLFAVILLAARAGSQPTDSMVLLPYLVPLTATGLLYNLFTLVWRMELTGERLRARYLWGRREIAFGDIGGIAVLVNSNVTGTVFARDFLIKDSAGSVWLASNADWKNFAAFREELERRMIAATGNRPRYLDNPVLGTAVEASAAYRALAVFMAGFMVLLFLVFHPFLGGWYRDHRLRESGETRIGLVAKKYEVENGRTAMTYVYLADGTVRRRDYRPHIGLWEKYGEDGPIELVFLPDNPEVSRTWDELHAMYIPYDAHIAVLASLLLGAVVYAIRYRRCRRFIELER